MFQIMQDENNFYLGVNCVITQLNVNELEKILNWSKKNEIAVNFTLGEIRERFRNVDVEDTIKIRNENINTLIL